MRERIVINCEGEDDAAYPARKSKSPRRNTRFCYTIVANVVREVVRDYPDPNRPYANTPLLDAKRYQTRPGKILIREMPYEKP